MGKYSRDDIVIVAAKRSILGAQNGSLKNLTAAELGANTVNGILDVLEEQAKKFNRGDIQYFVVGHSINAGIGQNLPKQVTRLSNMNNVESAFIVNELCGSGLEAIILGMQTLKLEEYQLALTGGIEFPSGAPYLITTRQLIDWQEKKVEEIQGMVVRADMHDALWCRMYDVHTIVHAENTTRSWVQSKGLDPERVKRDIDEYAVESHNRALDAISKGIFKDEIAVYADTSANDELPTKKNLDLLLKRKGTQFTPDGQFLSNHNSPPLANAASFLVLMKYSKAREYGFEVLARIVGYAKSNIEPRDFLLAPVMATKKLLNNTDTKIQDYDLLEINTAFGSQMIINKFELGLDMQKVNIYGDCIALGHPIGAAGARLMTTLVYALKRNKKQKGLVSICLGGGNAIAMAIERL